MIDSLIELIREYSKLHLVPEWITSTLVLFLLLIALFSSIFSIIYKIVKSIVKRSNEKILNKDLHPYFTKRDIYRYTNFYISQRFQNISPSEDYEPGQIYIASAKNKLMPLFINKIFGNYQGEGKYFLLLADTGMGKTAFLINLYINYKNKLHFFWQLPKYKIRLFPLGFPSVDKHISEISDKVNTILILDALDEDTKAIKDYKLRLGQILEITNEFRFVIITCRTQFFPTQKEEPYEAGLFTYGEHGQFKFQKLYLSVFTLKDVSKYLRKKFWCNPIKFYKAFKIVKKSPKLMMRPMLLSYVDDLVNYPSQYKFVFQIYDTLITKWISRESKKSAVFERYQSSGNYEQLLFSFSWEFALDIYKNKDKRGGYFVHHSEIIGPENGIQLIDFENSVYSLLGDDKKSRSLLNRDSLGNYKFAHKSILEYFLALELAKNMDYHLDFNFVGMDTTYFFYSEMVVEFLNRRKGYYFTNSKTVNFLLLSQLKLNDLIEVNEIIIEDASSLVEISVSKLAGLNKLQSLIIGDKYFASTYYIILCLLFEEQNSSVNSSTMRILQNEFLQYRSEFNHIKSLLMPNKENFTTLISALSFPNEIKQGVREVLSSEINFDTKVAVIRKLKALFLLNNISSVSQKDYIQFIRKMNILKPYLNNLKRFHY